MAIRTIKLYQGTQDPSRRTLYVKRGLKDQPDIYSVTPEQFSQLKGLGVQAERTTTGFQGTQKGALTDFETLRKQALDISGLPPREAGGTAMESIYKIREMFEGADFGKLPIAGGEIVPPGGIPQQTLTPEQRATLQVAEPLRPPVSTIEPRVFATKVAPTLTPEQQRWETAAKEVEGRFPDVAANIRKQHGIPTAPAPKAPPAPPKAGPTYKTDPTKSHLIRKGETLSQIAANYNTTVEAFQAVNPQIKDPNLIYAGQTLAIPIGEPITPKKEPPVIPGVKPEPEVEPEIIPGKGTLPDLPFQEVVAPEPTVEPEAEITPEVVQEQDSSKANEFAQQILDEIGETGEVDTRAATTILDKLEELIEGIEIPKAPEEPKSLVDLFNAKRAELGIEPLENELAEIDAEIDRINVTLLTEAEKAGEKLVSMGEITRRRGTLQTEAQQRIALLNVERNAISRQLGNKLGTLETVMSLTQSDFSNASTHYGQAFSRSVQMINLLEGYKSSEEQEQNRLRDDARANLNVVTNLFKNSTQEWDDLDAGAQTKIQSLENQAGLPVGVTQAFLSQLPKADLLTSTTGYDESGNQVVTFIYKDENGKPGVVEVVKTGVVKPPTAEETAGTALLFEDTRTGETFDLTTTEGLKRAGELGLSYSDARVALERKGLSQTTINALLEGADIKEPKKTGRTPEITDEVIRVEVRTEIGEGRTKQEIRDLITRNIDLTDADKDRYYLILGEMMPESKPEPEPEKKPSYLERLKSDIEEFKGFLGL